MKTTNLRSTALLTRYGTTVDRIALLEMQIKELKSLEEHICADVLIDIGERREVQVRGKIRILEPSAKTSYGRACDDKTAVEYCKAHGLTYSTRSPEYVAPATFTKYAKAGKLPPEMIAREETVSIVVH